MAISAAAAGTCAPSCRPGGVAGGAGLAGRASFSPEAAAAPLASAATRALPMPLILISADQEGVERKEGKGVRAEKGTMTSSVNLFSEIARRKNKLNHAS